MLKKMQEKVNTQRQAKSIALLAWLTWCSRVNLHSLGMMKKHTSLTTPVLTIIEEIGHCFKVAWNFALQTTQDNDPLSNFFLVKSSISALTCFAGKSQTMLIRRRSKSFDSMHQVILSIILILVAIVHASLQRVRQAVWLLFRLSLPMMQTYISLILRATHHWC